MSITACVRLAAPAAILYTAGALGADDAQATFRAVADKAGGAIVTIKHVLKVEGGGDSVGDDQETEVTAVMIDPHGLIVCANSVLLGQYGLMARFNPQAGLAVTPTEIKVLIGDDTEGVEAKVLSRDTELDLAWLQVEKPAADPYVFVDLGRSAEPFVGEPIVTVGRLGKFFDRRLMLHEARIVGTTSKPRELIIADGISTQPGSPDNAAGMPAFAADGKVVGIAVLQLPGAEEMSGGGAMDQIRGYDRMILPAAEVLKATERAKELAASGQGEPQPAPAGDGHAGDAGNSGQTPR